MALCSSSAVHGRSRSVCPKHNRANFNCSTISLAQYQLSSQRSSPGTDSPCGTLQLIGDTLAQHLSLPQPHQGESESWPQSAAFPQS